MDNLESILAIDNGIRLYWRTLAKLRCMSLHTGDIEYVLSDDRRGPERIYNVQLSPQNAEARIDEIAHGMKSGALPGGMLLTPLSTPTNIVELLRNRGFSIEDESPCMALDLRGFSASPTGEGIDVTPVAGGQKLRDWGSIVNDGLFGCELLSPGQYDDLHALGNTRLFLASYRGIPSSACMTVREGCDATLEFVATLPEYRRRGLGCAVVSQALEDLKQYGIEIVTLRAELMAVNLYKSLGFKEYCKRIVASV